MIIALLIAAAAQVSGGVPATPGDVGRAVREEVRANSSDACIPAHPGDLVVCKQRGSSRYRIDPVVLDTMRAQDAAPAKPSLRADAEPAGGCIGPQACTGGVIPLVGVAVAAAKAAVLAAKGDDWRDAFRTHEDAYQLYLEERARRASEKRVSVGLTVGARH